MARGNLDGPGAHTSGMIRIGSFGPLDSLTIVQMLEKKLAMQTAEVEKLIQENQRLASSHVVLRQDIVETENEMQRIRTHLGEVQAETDMQIRELLERITFMEADILRGDAVNMELHQVHMEAKRLITEREMMTLETENVSKELKKLSASADNKSLPELFAELDGLHKEHHNLRSQFEYEKNTNVKQVEQMQTMEKNLINMMKEAEKLRADVSNAKKRAQAAAAQRAATQAGTPQVTGVLAATSPYANAYASHPSLYQQGTQVGSYQQGSQAGVYQQGTQPGAYQQGTQPVAYQHGTHPGAYAYTTPYDANAAYQMHAAQVDVYGGYFGYPVAGYAQGAAASYSAAYAVPPQPMTNDAGLAPPPPPPGT